MRVVMRAMLLMALAILVLAPAWRPAAAGSALALSPEQRASVQKISDFMNSFTYLEGEFTQISPKGNTSRGIFYISKPGKMRFEYAPPNPFLIVADGKWLTIKNRDKEQGDQFPLSETPLRIVLAKQVDILKDSRVLAFEAADGLVAVTLEDKGGMALARAIGLVAFLIRGKLAGVVNVIICSPCGLRSPGSPPNGHQQERDLRPKLGS